MDYQRICTNCGDNYISHNKGGSKYCPSCVYDLSIERNKRANKVRRQKRRGYISGQTIEEQINAKLSKKAERRITKAQKVSKV